MRCGPEKDHVNLQTPSSSLEQSQTKSPGTPESTLTPLVLMQLVTHPSPSCGVMDSVVSELKNRIEGLRQVILL